MKLNEHLSKAETHLDSLGDHEISNFDFNWEGIQFHAAAVENSEGASFITVDGTLGRLFYTIEDKNQRAMALEQLFATNRQIDGKYSVSPRGDVSFSSVTKTDTVKSGSELMTAVTVILLQAERHLRTLRAHLKAAH